MHPHELEERVRDLEEEIYILEQSLEEEIKKRSKEELDYCNQLYDLRIENEALKKRNEELLKELEEVQAAETQKCDCSWNWVDRNED